jgi:hypothetical protein
VLGSHGRRYRCEVREQAVSVGLEGPETPERGKLWAMRGPAQKVSSPRSTTHKQAYRICP